MQIKCKHSEVAKFKLLNLHQDCAYLSHPFCFQIHSLIRYTCSSVKKNKLSTTVIHFLVTFMQFSCIILLNKACFGVNCWRSNTKSWLYSSMAEPENLQLVSPVQRSLLATLVQLLSIEIKWPLHWSIQTAKINGSCKQLSFNITRSYDLKLTATRQQVQHLPYTQRILFRVTECTVKSPCVPTTHLFCEEYKNCFMWDVFL